eukprot:6489869-Amphidinium_carterae.1
MPFCKFQKRSIVHSSWNEDIGKFNLSPKDWTYATTVSRKQFEESWTTVWEVGFLDAVYNGSCFALAIDSCAAFEHCVDASRQYPRERDESGDYQFIPQAAALEGLDWSASYAQVEAQNAEQNGLLEELEDHTDDSSQSAIYLRSALVASAALADTYLRRNGDSLLVILGLRIAAYKDLVRSETAPTPAQGSSQLPEELEALAREVEELT